jgi:integrase
MDSRGLSARLMTDQVYVLGHILERGAIVKASGQSILVVPLTPMTVDFLKGTRLPEFTNNLLTNKCEIVNNSVVLSTELTEGITIEELQSRYLADLAGRVSAQTCETYIRLFGFLIEILGEGRRLKSISREDMLKVRDIFFQIPFMATRLCRGLNLMQAIEKANQEGRRRISEKTANYLLFRITAIFNWAERQWLIDRNPAKRLGHIVNRSIARFKRRPFTIDHLQRIFHTPLYTGCIDDVLHYRRRGPNHPRNERFWIPLVGLFSGMRVGEILQMNVVDVVSREAIWCFHVTNQSDDGKKDKRLKTAAAERYVPIHSVLLHIGFLEFLTEAKQSGRQKLFPRTEMDNRGLFSERYSSWFTQVFLKKQYLYQPETTFHSFRHNFRDALRNGNTSVFMMKEVCGWSTSAVEFGYGGPPAIPALAKTVELVRYPGLDLSHLLTKAGEKAAKRQLKAVVAWTASVTQFDQVLLKRTSRQG